jgi:site-specific DNA recombinase
MSGRAVLYLRVSSGRQVDNTSLAEQERVLRLYCRDQRLTIERIFTESGQSAKTANRTEFQAMFAYLRSLPPGQVTHLIVHAFSRFDRHVEESAAYKLELRNDLKIALRSASEPVDDTASGRLLANILSSFAQYDNETKAERMTAAMKARVRAGRFVWCPPTGYRRGTKTGPSLELDPKLAPLVRRMFERVAAGEQRAAVLNDLTSQGLRSRRGGRLSQESMQGILTNVAYKGEVFSPKWKLAVKGDFEPIVSSELFDRVQKVLSTKSPVAVPHKSSRPEYPLRGLLLCPECMKPVTASTSKGEYGQRHRYYRCHRAKGHVNAKADIVEEAFLGLLDKLTPHPERMAFLESVYREVWTERNSNTVTDSEALRRELAKLKKRRSTAQDQMLDGHLSGPEYAEINQRLSVEIGGIEEQLARMKNESLNVDTAISYASYVLWNVRHVYETCDLQGKQRLSSKLFPKGLPVTKNGFWNVQTHSIYMLLADDSVDESEVVRPRRFELLTYSFGGCRSIQLSYGRAPLA